MYNDRYAELNDDQFECLLTGEKSYEELVTPPDETKDKEWVVEYVEIMCIAH